MSGVGNPSLAQVTLVIHLVRRGGGVFPLLDSGQPWVGR